MAGTLYLMPCPIAVGPIDEVMPGGVIRIARDLSYFLAENAKSARAVLKLFGHPQPLRELDIVEIGHDPAVESIRGWLEPVLQGRDAGLLSEAGCPGVADPGASIVAAAHRAGLRVRPLVGPSSLLLARMASGLNGHSFRFHGYLPITPSERAARLLDLERLALQGETQIFIETPYRTTAMFTAIVATCGPKTRLAVAVDLTGATEVVATHSIVEWRQRGVPALDRRAAVFSLLA